MYNTYYIFPERRRQGISLLFSCMHTITPDDYLRIVPITLRSTYHTGSAVDRLQRFFCPARQRFAKCTTHCTDCARSLVTIFEEARDFKDPRDPYAVLVWSIREICAKEADQEEARQVARERTDWTGERVDVNPFELLLGEQ